MCGDLLLGVYEVSHPISYLQLRVNTSVSSTTVAGDFSSNTATTVWPGVEFIANDLIFRRRRQVDFNAFEYQLDYERLNQKHVYPSYSLTELEEATEEISLSKLSERCKQGLDLKKLIIAYLRHGTNG